MCIFNLYFINNRFNYFLNLNKLQVLLNYSVTFKSPISSFPFIIMNHSILIELSILQEILFEFLNRRILSLLPSNKIRFLFLKYNLDYCGYGFFCCFLWSNYFISLLFISSSSLVINFN